MTDLVDHPSNVNSQSLTAEKPSTNITRPVMRPRPLFVADDTGASLVTVKVPGRLYDRLCKHAGARGESLAAYVRDILQRVHKP